MALSTSPSVLATATLGEPGAAFASSCACREKSSQLLFWKPPSCHLTSSCVLALNAAQVESATIATPGTRPVSWPSGTVRSTMNASRTPGSDLT